MNRRRVLLILAALVTVVGVALVYLYVRAADDRAAAQYDRVLVLKAAAPIEAGETIEDLQKAGKVYQSPVVRADVLPNAVFSADDVAGQVALGPIYPGEQLITDRFGKSSEADLSPLQIPKGLLAVSVNLDDAARVAGFVEPGSQVAIFLNGNAADGKPFSRTLLAPVTVLGVGSTTVTTTTTTTEDGAQTTEQLPRTLLTVAVSQQDAQKLLFAQSNGTLSFALLTGTSSVHPGPAVTADNLFR